MENESRIRRWPFEFCVLMCVQFVVLTVIAMLIYPGGSILGTPTRRYSFFTNFFSELGVTVTGSGNPNTPSMILFVIALGGAGVGMIAFFVAKTQLFRHRRAVHVLSWLGSAFGVLSGASYVGVAFTPANLARELHYDFVLTAFRAFLAVVAVYVVAILVNPGYPKRYAVVYLVFALLLAGYIWLMTQGPDIDTLAGLRIQATGQKVIVYAAILCVLVQSYGALQRSRPSSSLG